MIYKELKKLNIILHVWKAKEFIHNKIIQYIIMYTKTLSTFYFL